MNIAGVLYGLVWLLAVILGVWAMYKLEPDDPDEYR